ncbi:MAG TPA: glycine oxidase ThiO [Thiobacillaceae bacterium]|nr:glycine oxidase ThiO [Thiobacillaceae bacterium]HNA81778.1 glycine oxidase ThiO [Thiobacillaceae bacterium]HNF87707.1 glycine oxidase ThiO [Thiobacillaceae bacterium]HNH88569.1 glycine oxidase ThiO [Thiobacillaceae bacterium]HNI06738.1 glycine oxidase ThiO [Thiobacillaceae bacterium]
MHTDFLIIGAGVVGLSTALECARRGASVTVLDKGIAGQESTWSGAGILSPLLPWHYADPVNVLANYSRGLYAAWCADLQSASGIDPEYRTSGMLVLPPWEVADANVWCDRHGWRREIRESRDFLPSFQATEGLWLPEVAQARNPRLIKALKGASLAAGVRIIENAPVAAMDADQDRITGVHAAGTAYGADHIVLATGAWTGWLPGLEAFQARIYPVRGQILLFMLPVGSLETIVYRNGQYLVPRADGHVLAGSTLETAGFDKSTTAQAKRDIMDFTIDLLPEVREVDVVMQWSGLRPGSPDNVPCIGRHPAYANLYLNAGHYRYGVTMAPGSARLLADLMFGEPTAIDPAPFRVPE